MTEKQNDAAACRVRNGVAYASGDPDPRTALIEAIHHGKFTVADLREVLRQLDDAKTELGALQVDHALCEPAHQITRNSRARARAEVERLTRERDDLHAFDVQIQTRPDDEQGTLWLACSGLPFRNFKQRSVYLDDLVRVALSHAARCPELKAQHGQETAQEAAGDDPDGSVGNDARDDTGDAQNGAEDVRGET